MQKSSLPVLEDRSIHETNARFIAEMLESLRERSIPDLQIKADLLTKHAPSLSLQNLGQARVAEILSQPLNRIPRLAEAELERHREQLHFSRLLQDPRFSEYHQLYPARKLTRQWTAYLGPTNSGKTHGSIQALVGARRGIYLSPLRLMALENQERIEQMGVPCSLVTGEEEIIRDGATHFCCTVEEFARFRHEFWDVVIVDEVQLLADPKRGWAWVDALVGAQTPQLMMTGPLLVEPSLRTLSGICGDPIEVIQKQRLSPVSVSKHPISLKGIEPGSLVVAFSRRAVLELKGMLESYGRTVSVVYGALSPEVRKEQARRFRDGDTEIMVATDAIGMGLNLPARTLCFYAAEKFDGAEIRPLTVQEAKQIGGRAGRFGMAEAGIITAFDYQTLRTIRNLFVDIDTPLDLKQFQVRPSFEHLQIIHEEFSEKSLLGCWQIFNRNINYGKDFIAVLPDELAEWLSMIDDSRYPLWLRWVFACTPVRGGFEGRVCSEAITWLDDIFCGYQVLLPKIALKSDLEGMEESLQVVETYIHLAKKLGGFMPDAVKAIGIRDELNNSITRILSRTRQKKVKP